MTDHGSSTTAKLALPSQFALHLMASLVGTSKLEEYLLLGEPSQTLPLYWRTSVLFANDSTASFADISMTIDAAKESVESKEKHELQPLPLKISVGVLRRGMNDGDYRYSQGVLREDILTSYLESVGIDVETTDPSVMAKSMAQALVSMSMSSFEATNSPQLLQSDISRNSSFCISLHHQDVEESGHLTIDMESDCALSSAAATMLLSNLSPSCCSTTVLVEEYDTSELERTIVERLVAMQANKKGGYKRGRQVDGHSSVSTGSAAMTKLSPKKQSVIRSIRPPRGGGVRASSNRRKKAKTLSYGGAKK